MVGKIVSAGVDWLTASTRSDERTANLISYVVWLFWSKDRQTPLVHDFKFHGFAGRAIEGARWGLRGEEGLVQLSGNQAFNHWREVANRSDNVSRIDYQVTFHLEVPFVGLGEAAFKAVSAQGRLKSVLYQNSAGGATCYVGSRTSRYFGRIYDKGAQSGGAPGLIWRYEVEIKKPQALPESEALALAANETEHVKGFVHEWFQSRGILPVFFATSAVDAIEAPKNLTTEEKMLQWLVRQVKPAVGKLVNAGRGSEVYEALGLPEPSLMDNYSQFLEDV